MKNTIELKHVSKEYPGFHLKDVSFCIPAGTIVGLVGENGAGKTTTIQAILNSIHFGGEIQIFGKDNRVAEKEIKQDLGVVLDDSFLSEYLSAKGVGAILKMMYANWDEKKYDTYLKKFKLPSSKLIKSYSSGMKMKLKIAAALSHCPKLLVLDEPTSGLDPIVRNEILDIFRDYILEDESRSILLSSHITTDLESIADYIVFLNEGEIVFQLPTSNIKKKYGILKCSEKEFEQIQKEDVIRYQKRKYQYEVLISDKQKMRKKYPFAVIDKATIDEIMLFYVKGEK